MNICEETVAKLNQISTQLGIPSLITCNNESELLDSLCEKFAFSVNETHSLIAAQLKLHSLRNIIAKSLSELLEKCGGAFSDYFYDFIISNEKELESMVVMERNNIFNWFALNTLLKGYVISTVNEAGDRIPRENPQHMYLRVAIQLYAPNLRKIKEYYDFLSLGLVSHASPTMFNSCLKKNQLSSCFLMCVEDSMEHITKMWSMLAKLSANHGGIGVDFSALRHSKIGFSGMSGGIVPCIQVSNSILRYVDQGGRRRGSGTMNLPMWHIDIEPFLELKNEDGNDTIRARESFYSVFISDLFMKRVEKDEVWSLFCPNRAPGLNTTWGEEFENLYTLYEEKGVYSRRIRARELLRLLIQSQIINGMPFALFKDNINRKCNQNNLGTIRTSNLCVEITEFVSKDEVASCNLASLPLPRYVEDGKFSFELLGKYTRVLVRSLNKLVDKSYCPIKEVLESNRKNRPIAIGVQGLADVFAMLNLPWESEEALMLNNAIFETMYYHGIDESINLAKKGGAYGSYNGSMLQQGFLQFDLWDREEMAKKGMGSWSSITLKDIQEYRKTWSEKKLKRRFPMNFDWNVIREKGKKHGYRNSLIFACMPTASTAHILCNNECFEPFTSNVYVRNVLSGSFVVFNKHLITALEKEGLWNEEIKQKLIDNRGSVSFLESTHKKMADVFKTAYEIPQKRLAKLANSRGRWICQSQSFNFWKISPTESQIASFLFYQWKKGAKTGMYYLRSKAAYNPTNMTKKEQACDGACSA